MTPAIERIIRIRGADPTAPTEVPRWPCGHERTEVNTFYANDTVVNGSCRECRVAWQHEHRRRKREGAA